MKNLLWQCAALLFTLTIGSNSHAGVIVVSADSNINLNSSQLSTFYGNMFSGQDVYASPGAGFFVSNTQGFMIAAASTFARGAVSSSALTGKDWFVGGGDGLFTVSEIGAIANFFQAGGNVFLIGEASSAFDLQNTSVNAVLSAIGSTMQVGAPRGAENAWAATNSNIAVDPLTFGITRFGGSFAATVTGGTALFSNDQNGRAIVSVERINTSTGTVPEPTSLAIWSVCLIGITLRLRRTT